MSDQTKEQAATSTAVPLDPFSNLEEFKVGQDFNEFQAVIDYSVIPLRKPGRQQWFRVHDTLRLDNVCFLEVEQEEGPAESFMLTASVAPSLVNLPGISKRSLRLCVCRPNNSPFLWAIKMPKGTGTKHDEWSVSAMKIAAIGEGTWVRMSSDMQLGAYKHHTATAEWAEPTWPSLSISEVLRRSIGDRHIISSVDHPVIKQLLGLQ